MIGREPLERGPNLAHEPGKSMLRALLDAGCPGPCFPNESGPSWSLTTGILGMSAKEIGGEMRCVVGSSSF